MRSCALCGVQAAQVPRPERRMKTGKRRRGNPSAALVFYAGANREWFRLAASAGGLTPPESGCGSLLRRHRPAPGRHGRRSPRPKARGCGRNSASAPRPGRSPPRRSHPAAGRTARPDCRRPQPRGGQLGGHLAVKPGDVLELAAVNVQFCCHSMPLFQHKP